MAAAIAIIYFIAISVGVGIYSTRRVKTAGAFQNADKSLSWMEVGFCFVLIPLGAGHTLSLWESSFDFGASALWWGITAGGIFLPICMFFFGPMVRRSGLNTMPEILEKVTNKQYGRLCAAIAIGSNSGIGAAETLATAAAVYGLGGGNIPFVGCIGIALVLIAIYVIFAGALQFALLNRINAFVMIACSYAGMITLGIWLAANVGGWVGVQQIFEGWGKIDMLQTYNLGNPGVWFAIIFPVLILHTFGAAVSQNMNVPFFAAKDDASCRKGVFFVAGFNIGASFPWIVLAMVTVAITQSDHLKHLLPGMIDNPDVAKLGVIELVMTGLPAPVVGLMMIALLCSTLSTGGSFAIANATVLTNDVFKRCLKPDMSEATRLKVFRLSVVIIVALFAFPAFLNAILFPVFLWCFSFLIPAFFIWLTAMKMRRNVKAAWITAIAGYAVACIWTFVPGVADAAGASGVLFGAFGVGIYPVFFVSLICSLILPWVIPGGKPPLIKGKISDAPDTVIDWAAAEAE